MFEIIENGTVTSPKGYLAGATNVGIKTDTDELDVGILWTNNKDAYCTGVFTQNSIVSHSVTASRQNINGKLVKGVVANSGCANCGVGEQGLIDAKEVIKLTSEFLGCDENNLAICSTGLIGEELPMALIRKNISNIKLSKNDGKEFAKSILTTDTKTKEIAVSYEFNGKTITIGGCAKGVGMIHPNMATMLAFITTDAKLDNSFQDNILKRIVNGHVKFYINLGSGTDRKGYQFIPKALNKMQGNIVIRKLSPKNKSYKFIFSSQKKSELNIDTKFLKAINIGNIAIGIITIALSALNLPIIYL